MVYGRHWGMTLFTFLKGQYMGQDAYGNKYYQERGVFKISSRKRRWVMYKGHLEGSQVCPEWFGWLHHYSAMPLESSVKKDWQRPYKCNMTGTSKAYCPIDYTANLQKVKSEGQAYDSWKP